MKIRGLFRSKPRTPVDVVRQTRNLLIYAGSTEAADHRDSKRDEKMAELCRNVTEMQTILFGTCETVPVARDCQQLTVEFFKEDTLRLLVNCLPLLDKETRSHACQIFASVQKQQVSSPLMAVEYLEANLDVIDRLIEGVEDLESGLFYGDMLKECIRHQAIAKYVLESQQVRKFFSYINISEMVIASRAAEIFEALLTRHKSTVVEFLSNNYGWFFPEYHSKLLQSSIYYVRRYGTKVLASMLLDRSYAGVMTTYVSSEDNLKILMNLFLGDKDNKHLKLEAFHVFKLFAANQNKPQTVVKILAGNKMKLIQFLSELEPKKDSNQFEEDKAVVIREIEALDPNNPDGMSTSS